MIPLLKFYLEPAYFWLDEVWLDHSTAIKFFGIGTVLIFGAMAMLGQAIQLELDEEQRLMALCLADDVPEYKCTSMIIRRGGGGVAPVAVPIYGG